MAAKKAGRNQGPLAVPGGRRLRKMAPAKTKACMKRKSTPYKKGDRKGGGQERPIDVGDVGHLQEGVGMVYVGILKSPGKHHILKALPRIEYMEDTGEFS